MQTAAPFPQPKVYSFIHSISMNSFMVASVHRRTGYVEICSVCVLTQGTVVQGKIRECSKDVLFGRLFIETALLTVKQNRALLCHSQFVGSQGCVTMIC
jgi:vacuolar-type H+-ATPase subunit B/Vma2